MLLTTLLHLLFVFWDAEAFVARPASESFRHNSFIRAGSRDYLSIDEIEEFAKFNNLTLKSEVKGPYLRLEAFTNGDVETKVGYLTAFIRPFPFKLFQLDTIQVLNRRQTLGFKRKGWKMDGPGIRFTNDTNQLLFSQS